MGDIEAVELTLESVNAKLDRLLAIQPQSTEPLSKRDFFVVGKIPHDSYTSIDDPKKKVNINDNTQIRNAHVNVLQNAFKNRDVKKFQDEKQARDYIKRKSLKDNSVAYPLLKIRTQQKPNNPLEFDLTKIVSLSLRGAHQRYQSTGNLNLKPSDLMNLVRNEDVPQATDLKKILNLAISATGLEDKMELPQKGLLETNTGKGGGLMFILMTLLQIWTVISPYFTDDTTTTTGSE